MSSHTQPLLNGEHADNGCIPSGDLAIRVQHIVNDGAHDAPSPKNSEEMEQYHQHYSDRAPWLRAAVLGANDGLVSVASIMLGVSGGSQDKHTLLLTGLSALVAGENAVSLVSMTCVTRAQPQSQGYFSRHTERSAKQPRVLQSSSGNETSHFLQGL